VKKRCFWQKSDTKKSSENSVMDRPKDKRNSMQALMNPSPLRAPRNPVAVLLALNCLVAVHSACAALESGVYQTVPGSTVKEFGDALDRQTRVVPFSATVTLDLEAAPASLTAFIANAVLEGSHPFPLTVRSSEGGKLNDGTYWFRGDYLREIRPSGTQYLFEWKFSTAPDGRLVWDGTIGWAGGHLWEVTISNVTIVAQPFLSIASEGIGSVQISWATNFTEHVLESANQLPAPSWNTVTNAVTVTGNRFVVAVNAGGTQRFFRLRKP
jgi:hypothetical protein